MAIGSTKLVLSEFLRAGFSCANCHLPGASHPVGISGPGIRRRASDSWARARVSSGAVVSELEIENELASTVFAGLSEFPILCRLQREAGKVLARSGRV